MSAEWKARRFWTDAGAQPSGDRSGWEVTLDARVLRTPGNLPLILPTEALARAVADEWTAQGEVIAPLTMPLIRAVNSAVERVARQHDAVAAMLAAYAETDLLSYRAEGGALAQRQAAQWQPLLDWAADRFGARLAVTEGVIPIPQDADALSVLAGQVRALDDFALTALHDLVTLPGSLILGLAVLEGRLDAGAAHDLSRLEEVFQAEQWGHDAEAEAMAEARGAAMRVAERLLHLSRQTGTERQTG